MLTQRRKGMQSMAFPKNHATTDSISDPLSSGNY